MTGPGESEWRARFRASLPDEPESEHPPAETLWRAVRGELPARDLESLASHLRSCGACGDAMAVSAELLAESEPRILPWKDRRIGAAAAGLTALAAGLLVFLAHRAPGTHEGSGPDLSPSRGEVSEPTIRPLSRDEQPASDARLQWTPVAGAVRYRVLLSTEDLRPVHDRTLEGTTLAIPPGLGDFHSSGVARQGEAGRSGPVYLWQVEASLPDGRTVTSSTFRLRLIPPPAGAPR